VDYNVVLTPYAEDKTINTVIEIPMGSSNKIEYDRKIKVMRLDRVESKIFAKPTNYGFIPGTLDDDGDELDTLVITEESLPTGVVVEATVIGVMEFEDNGEMDHKVICVPADERNTGNRIQTLADMGDQLVKQIEHHFSHYKDLKSPGSTKVLGFSDAAKAHAIIAECIDRWNTETKV